MLDWNDHQFCNPCDLHHGEGLSLHAAVGEVDNLSHEEVIAMQVEKHLGRIRMVDIANFELDPLVSHIHPPCPSSPQALLFGVDPYSRQEACHGVGERLFSPTPLMGHELRPSTELACQPPTLCKPERGFRWGVHSGKGVPHRGVWHIHTPTDAGCRQAVLPRQVVFVQLVVDATGRNPEQLGRVRLIPMRPVQRGLEQ